MARQSNPVRSGDSAFNYPGEEDEDRVTRLRKAERIGRPVGDAAFLDRLEGAAGRSLRPGRPGPKPR